MKFRSKYEETVWNDAQDRGFEVEYETLKLPYVIHGNYYPDFILKNGIIVETKGYFDGRARAKMIAVKKANPGLDIRLLFMNSKTKLRKGSKLTYADWCEKYGFLYSDGMIPLAWIKEKKR